MTSYSGIWSMVFAVIPEDVEKRLWEEGGVTLFGDTGQCKGGYQNILEAVGSVLSRNMDKGADC